MNWRIKLTLLYLVVAVLGLAWYGGPGLLVGLWISDWELVGWSTKHWVGGIAGAVITYSWSRLTSKWLYDRFDAPLDRAVDWATR